MDRKKAIVLFSVVGILLSTVLLVGLIVAFGKSEDHEPEAGEEGSNTEPSDSEKNVVLQSGSTTPPNDGGAVGDKVGEPEPEPTPKPTPRRRHTGATGHPIPKPRHQGATGPGAVHSADTGGPGATAETGGHKGTPVGAGTDEGEGPREGGPAAPGTPGPAGPTTEAGRHPDTPRPTTEAGRRPDTPRPTEGRRRHPAAAKSADPKGGYTNHTISTEAKRRNPGAAGAAGAAPTAASNEAGGHQSTAGATAEHGASASEQSGTEEGGHQGGAGTAGKKRRHSANRGGSAGKEGTVRVEEAERGPSGGHSDTAGPGGETEAANKPAANPSPEPSMTDGAPIPMPAPEPATTTPPTPPASPATPREPTPTGIPKPATVEENPKAVGLVPRTEKSRSTRRTKYELKADDAKYFPDFGHVFNRPDKYAEDAKPENRMPYEALYDVGYDKLSFEHTYNWSYGRDPKYQYKYFELDYPKMYEGTKRRFWDIELSPFARYVSAKKPKVRTTKVSIYGVSFVEKIALNRENVTLFMENVHGLNLVSVITADMEGMRSGLQFITQNGAYNKARINTNYLHLIDYIFKASAGVQ